MASMFLRELQLENENGFNAHTKTQPRKDDEKSSYVSKLWFGNNTNVPQNHERVNDDSKTVNPEDNQTALPNEEQEYWQ